MGARARLAMAALLLLPPLLAAQADAERPGRDYEYDDGEVDAALDHADYGDDYDYDYRSGQLRHRHRRRELLQGKKNDYDYADSEDYDYDYDYSGTPAKETNKNSKKNNNDYDYDYDYSGSPAKETNKNSNSNSNSNSNNSNNNNNKGSSSTGSGGGGYRIKVGKNGTPLGGSGPATFAPGNRNNEDERSKDDDDAGEEVRPSIVYGPTTPASRLQIGNAVGDEAESGGLQFASPAADDFSVRGVSRTEQVAAVSRAIAQLPRDYSDRLKALLLDSVSGRPAPNAG